MDNPYKNWRNYVLWALFLCGVLSMFIAFGDPDENTTLGAWVWHLFKYAFISIVSFSAMGVLIMKWREEGKISEF